MRLSTTACLQWTEDEKNRATAAENARSDVLPDQVFSPKSVNTWPLFYTSKKNSQALAGGKTLDFSSFSSILLYTLLARPALPHVEGNLRFIILADVVQRVLLIPRYIRNIPGDQVGPLCEIGPYPHAPVTYVRTVH